MSHAVGALPGYRLHTAMYEFFAEASDSVENYRIYLHPPALNTNEPSEEIGFAKYIEPLLFFRDVDSMRVQEEGLRLRGHRKRPLTRS